MHACTHTHTHTQSKRLALNNEVAEWPETIAFGRGVAEWPESWLLALGKQRRLRAAMCKARQVLALTAFVCASDGRWYAFGRGVAEWPECWLLALGKQRRLRAAICKARQVLALTCKRRALVCIWQRSGGVAWVLAACLGQAAASQGCHLQDSQPPKNY